MFSILIPTWNNLSYLKLCIKSIQKNSYFEHQILIHVNEGSDGTLEWVRQSGLEYTYSEKNIGICWALNKLRTKVKTDYIVYVNDDMYVLPGWDTAINNEIKSLPDNKFFLSSTLIEPRKSSKNIITADYGTDYKSFDEERLLKEYMNETHYDWFGSTTPLNIVPTELWDLVGGYSVEFSPGMYSDPDFTAKLWMAGVRYLKGLSASRVYHFAMVSTTRVKKNKGDKEFLMKWGITSSTFRKCITKRYEVFDASKLDDIHTRKLKRNILRSKLKKMLYIFDKDDLL